MPSPAGKALSGIAWGSVLAVALTAHFLGQTLSVARGGASSALLGGAVAGLVLVLAAVGIPRLSELEAAGTTRVLSLAASGAVGFGVAPWLVVTHRYSDAPSGSEALFFTTAAWGVLVVLAASAVSAERPSAVKTVLAFLALLAAAGIVADWERPSSFSPFQKFPAEEAFMLLGGACLALTAVVLRRAMVRFGVRVPAVASALGGLLGVVLLLGVTGALPAAIERLVAPESFVVTAAVAWGVAVLALMRLLASTAVVSASVPLFLPPALLTAGTGIEALVGMMGPRPLVLVPLFAALAVLGVALLGIVSDDSSASEDARALPPRAIVPLLALLLGAAALASPALDVAVSGSLQTGSAYDVRFTYAGYETIGGWLAFLLAAVLLAAALSGRGPFAPRPSVCWGWTAGVIVVAACWFPLAEVPLHTWNRWIPATVQQDFGTEYARIVFTPLPVPLQAAAVAACVVTVVLGVLARLSLVRTRRSEGPEVH